MGAVGAGVTPLARRRVHGPELAGEESKSSLGAAPERGEL